jgi:hypothetical protein
VKSEHARFEEDEKVKADFHLVLDEQVENEAHESIGKRNEEVEKKVENKHEREILIVVLLFY